MARHRYPRDELNSLGVWIIHLDRKHQVEKIEGSRLVNVVVWPGGKKRRKRLWFVEVAGSMVHFVAPEERLIPVIDLAMRRRPGAMARMLKKRKKLGKSIHDEVVIQFYGQDWWRARRRFMKAKHRLALFLLGDRSIQDSQPVRKVEYDAPEFRLKGLLKDRYSEGKVKEKREEDDWF